MAGRSDEAKIVAKLSAIYAKSRVVNGCRIVDGRGATTRDGYRRCFLRYPGERPVNTTLHRAVFIMENRDPSLIRNKAAGEVSHRCGNKACITIGHLVLEQPSQNSNRRSCHRDGRCYGCLPPCIIVPDDR